MNIQRRYGLFPRIIGKGDCARRLADALIRMRGEEDASDTSPFTLTPSSILGELIVVDRETDLMTPLLTQLTYEGLIDETIGIHNCIWPKFLSDLTTPEMLTEWVKFSENRSRFCSCWRASATKQSSGILFIRQPLRRVVTAKEKTSNTDFRGQTL